MAISVVGVSNAAGQSAGNSVANTASVTPTMPVGTAAGDRVWYWQAYSNNATPNTPSGWTAPYGPYQIGTGTSASGSGARRGIWYYRDYDGVWTMPAFALNSIANNMQWGVAITLRKTSSAYQWADPVGLPTGGLNGAFNAATTAWTWTRTGANGFTTNDLVLVGTGFNDNVTSSAAAISQSGTSFGTLTERADGGISSGHVISGKLHTCTVTSAGGTGNITMTQTLSAASQGEAFILSQGEILISGTLAATAPKAVMAAHAPFAPVSLFNEEFNDISQWDLDSLTTPLPYASGGKAQISSASGANQQTGITTPARYDLTNGSITWKIDQIPSVAGTPFSPNAAVYFGDFGFLFYDDGSGNASITDGIHSPMLTPSVPVYLRVSHGSGVLSFDYSTDGSTWTSFGTPEPDAAYDLTGQFGLQAASSFFGGGSVELQVDWIHTTGSSTTGVLGSTALKATMGATGTQAQSGALAAAALKPTISAAGTSVENPTGALAASALKPTMAATGAQAQSGALAASALKPQMGAAGTTVENPTGALSASALKSTASLTGTQAQSGALAASAMKAQMAASGVQFDMPIGTLASTAPKAQMSAVGARLSKAEELKYDFDTDLIETDGKWFGSRGTGSGYDSRLHLSDGVLYTALRYDLRDSYVSVELVNITDPLNQFFLLAWHPDYGTGNYIGLSVNGTSLAAASNIYGYFVSVPYDPVAHRWLRIRADTTDAGIWLEYSADGLNWTALYAGGNGGHVLGNVVVAMHGNVASVGGSGEVVVDNLNLQPFVGSLTSSAPKPTMSASGDQAQTGTLASTALKAVVSLTGAQVQSGALTTAALKAQAALSGAQTQIGSLAASALKSGASLAGSHVENPTGTFSASALKATASLNAAQQYLAALAASALKSVMSFAGDSTSPPGVLSGNAQISTASMTGEMPASGVLSALSRKAVAALNGTQEQSGALTASALKAVASFNAQQIFTGILSGTALKSTAALTGLEEYVATLSASAQKALASLTGEQPTSGILTAASVKAIMASAGTALQTGALTMTALKAAAAFTAAQEYTGTLTASAKKALASFNAAQSQSGILGASALKAVASLTATLTNSGVLHAVARKALAALTGTSTVDTSLPRFAVVGKLKTIGIGMAESALRSAIITFKPNIPPEVLARYLEKMFRVRPVVAHLDVDGNIVNTDGDPVRLLAEHNSLNLEGLQWQVSVRVPASIIPPIPEQKFRSWWIDAGFNGDTIDVIDAVPEHEVHGVHYR